MSDLDKLKDELFKSDGEPIFPFSAEDATPIEAKDWWALLDKLEKGEAK